MINASQLPVAGVIPELKAALASQKRALLQASPGAGKTTHVPPALLNEPWLKGREIIMLEPRRLAARASALYMAQMMGESVGRTVGYQMRMERRMGPCTRIKIITQGILTRMLQSDPALENVGLVIFDEFHERHIQSDFGLGLCLESAEVLRDDLRILIMSATMDMDALSALMDNAPMITSQGRSYPVTTTFLPPEEGDILKACAGAVKRALNHDPGDILVFLPGAAEIRRLARMLADSMGQETAESVKVMPLYGNLSPGEQAAAIAPSLPGRRKIVIATSIAETSLTIEGVRVVVDSGLMRVPRFFPGTGMSRLETIPVSKASADQRRGRAGRTQPGVCYRLWSRHVHKGLVPFNRPEILSADLTGVVLELFLWGTSDPGDLKWLDPPPRAEFSRAGNLLLQLGALDKEGRVTDHGRKIASSGIHPRLAHMILIGERQGRGLLACRLASLLSERDIVFFEARERDPDVRLRLDILEAFSRNGSYPQTRGIRINKKVIHTILKTSAKLQRDLGVTSSSLDAHQAGSVLALAYPERVAKKRNSRELTYVTAGGSGICFRDHNALSSLTYIVAVHLDAKPGNAGIFLAAAYSGEELEQDFRHQLHVREQVVWDNKTGSVRASVVTSYGKLLLRDVPDPRPDPETVKKVLIQGIRRKGLGVLPWTRELRNFQHRALFLKKRAGFQDLPDLSDTALSESLGEWLAPFLGNVRSAEGLKQVDLSSALKALLTWEQQQIIKKQAPTHVTVPSGSRVPLKYADDKGMLEFPVLAVRLQEMFGLTRTPAVAGNKIPVTLHLLSPAGRPVQITRDLENFWKHTYRDVKKDLMGRYPRHYWPNDPLTAVPTNRAKPGAQSVKKSRRFS